jgi:bifunctional DNA-binding transcriptional regulator/antitoxin component of YhaV-PrlF toxin-antitoxin module
MPKEVKNRRGRTRISSKHQVTIPSGAFRAAGLHPGDTLQVEAAGRGRIVLTSLQDELDRFDGCLGPGAFPEGFLEELRREWE